MDAVTYPDPAVRTELEGWLVQRVDVSEAADLARSFGVPAVPTAVAVDGDGRILGRSQGFVEPDVFARWLGKTRGD